MPGSSSSPTWRPALRGSFRRALQKGHEEALLDLAVSRGFISEDVRDELEEGLAEALARGLLDSGQVTALEASLAQVAFSDDAPALPAEVQPWAQVPERQLDGIILCERLGQGGTGEVWKAWERALGRWVAVKRPRAEIEEIDFERLQREAMAIARIQHPNVVPVFRVGQMAGRPYMVMPLVTGRTLAERVPPLMQAVAAIHDAALALHHAHGQGFIHRDVKPSNLMLDEDGRLWVLDFGLVHWRALGVERTRPGLALGTAAYMSPEQARGDEGSRAPTTDVYGLGATLYHLATGEPPFAGESFSGIVSRVLTQDPPRPRARNPALPADLETVILTAMAKDPRDRYATAAALAEDLGRVLRDEPVLARRPGRVARGLRLVRKRPRRAALALAIVAGVGAGALYARHRVVSEQRQALDAIRQVARLSLDTALRLRRLGDHAGMRQVLPGLEDAYRRAHQRAPRLAEVEYLMGRMYRALMDEARALARQEAALEKDPHFAPALYERVILLSRRYDQVLQRRLGTVTFGSSPGIMVPGLRAAGQDARRAAERSYPELARVRETILTDARKARDAGLDAALVLTLRGYLAVHEGNPVAAQPLLESALARDPNMEEAWELLAIVVETRHRFTEAERVYDRALTRDRGYTPFLVGRCRMRHERDDFDGAIADASAALAMDETMLGAWMCRGRALAAKAHAEMLAGKDPMPNFTAAARDFDQALSRDRAQLGGRWGRATMLRYRAQHLMRTGGDPLPDLDAAEEELDHCLSIDRGTSGLWTARGRTRALRGYVRAARGEDPTRDFTSAEADFRAADQLVPDNLNTLQWLADMYARRARWRLSRGEDPTADFAAAEAAFARVLRPDNCLNPWACFHRAQLRTWQGEAVAQTHGDPRPLWTKAEADIAGSLARSPGTADFWLARARLHQLQAQHAPPAERKRRAKAAAADRDKAAALNPRLRPW